MSVLHALYNTYTNYEDQAGEVIAKERDGSTHTYMLLPFAHTTQTAHIEIYVTEQGDYHSANVLPKVSTVLPFTENSGSRAGKVFFPHALHDKLMYVAGDYAAFMNEPEKAEAYIKYKEQLAHWAQSTYTHPDVQAIYTYIAKGTVIRDLVKEGVLHVDENGLLLNKWTSKEEKPAIFQVVTSGQEAAFVRFRVRKAGEHNIPPWENKELFAKYTQYYMSTIHGVDLCYITGKESVRTMKHPNKIRNAGDKGKLISANDDTGFTYRGRFKSTKVSSENASISYEASQKIHNALKWLIERQGMTIDGRVYVVWSERQIDVPHFLALPDIDLSDLWQPVALSEEVATSEQMPMKQHTNQLLAKNVAKLMQGMNAKIPEKSVANEHVHILSLDAATTGRLSILSYRNFQTSQYFERLAMYQMKASWLQTVRIDKKERTYMQAPTLRTIAEIAYGPRANDKLVKQTVERLIPVILEQRPIPFDVVQKMLTRASNPHSFEDGMQFKQAVEVACSVMKHHFDKEEYTVALQEQHNNRSYLFGRLLAVAEAIERKAQLEDKRTTNAMRYMNAFQMNPQRTWMTIYHSLTPYRQKLGGSGMYYDRVLQDIMALFEADDYMSNKALDGRYLLGYYSQLNALYTKKDKMEGTNDDSVTTKN